MAPRREGSRQHLAVLIKIPSSLFFALQAMTVSQCIKNGGREVDKHGEGIFALWETHLKHTHNKYLPSKRGRLISCASWKLVLRMYLQKYIFSVTSFFCAPEGFVSLSFTTWHELNFEHHQLQKETSTPHFLFDKFRTHVEFSLWVEYIFRHPYLPSK